MNKGTILISEDQAEFRKIYGDRLRFSGYTVLDAEDGNEALEQLNSQQVDLIMTDLNMPNKDGFDLISDVRANEKTKQIPIIVMSVFDQPEHLERALKLGANDYLVKGRYSPNDVLNKVEDLLIKK